MHFVKILQVHVFNALKSELQLIWIIMIKIVLCFLCNRILTHSMSIIFYPV